MRRDSPVSPGPPGPPAFSVSSTTRGGATGAARFATVVGAALPPLLLAALGTAHPDVLTPESATWWRDLHIIGVVLFPLLALPPWLVVRGRGRGLEITVAVLGLVYGAFYTALDAIAGIGGGAATLAVGPGPWVSSLFGVADQVALPGVYAYLAASIIAAVAVVATTLGVARVSALVGGLLVVGGAWSFMTSHIYYPYGVATMTVLAVGWAVLAVAGTATTPAPAARARHGR